MHLTPVLTDNVSYYIGYIIHVADTSDCKVRTGNELRKVLRQKRESKKTSSLGGKICKKTKPNALCPKAFLIKLGL